MNIIKKLGVKRITENYKVLLFDTTCSECDAEDSIEIDIPIITSLESSAPEMLTALIDGIIKSEKAGGGLCTESMYKAVEEATDMKWDKIQDILQKKSKFTNQ